MDPEVISAVLALIFISISVLVGLILISKYFKSGDKTLLLVGVSWIIIVEPWMPSAVNLVYKVITQNYLPIQARVIIGNVALPLGVLLWTIVITELVFKDYRQILLIIIGIVGVLFEIILFIGIFTNIDFIVITSSHQLNTNYPITMVIFQLIFSIYALATGLAFSYKSIGHSNQEIKLRGKLLSLAFIFFLIGALLGIFDLYILGNIIMIPSSILFYFAYILPNFIRKRLIKK